MILHDLDVRGGDCIVAYQVDSPHPETVMEGIRISAAPILDTRMHVVVYVPLGRNQDALVATATRRYKGVLLGQGKVTTAAWAVLKTTEQYA